MAEPLELHPEVAGERFTLRGIFRTPQAAEAKFRELVSEGLKVVRFEAKSPNGNALFFVAAHHTVVPEPRAKMPHAKTPDWVAAAYAVKLFRMVVRSTKRKRGPIRWYKPLDVEALRACFTGIQWNARRLDVAGQILSTIVATHPFPNANHRTSLSIVRVFLECSGTDWPGYSLRGQGERRLFRATHPFFTESKYLLQLLRHRNLVRVAHEEGFTHLHIGPGTQAEIAAKDLALSPQQVRERHEALCRRTIRDVALESVKAQLDAENRAKLKVWIEWLKRTK